MFLAPLILLYELGIVRYGGDVDIVARQRLLSFFEILGVPGYHLPAAAVVATLLGWHMARKDAWQFQPQRYVFMLLESIALAIPLLVFMNVLSRTLLSPPAMVVLMAQMPFREYASELLLSIGAGIYEELLFRLIAIALLHLIVYDMLALPRKTSAVITIVLSSAAFAWYHFTQENPFTWGKFLLYSMAGVYFAGLYLIRGFGIAAGVHAMYDVMVVLEKMYAASDG